MVLETCFTSNSNCNRLLLSSNCFQVSYWFVLVCFGSYGLLSYTNSHLKLVNLMLLVINIKVGGENINFFF